jgi:hypothetical protein
MTGRKAWIGLGISVAAIIAGLALWYFTLPPAPVGIAAQNQEVGKQQEVIAEKDRAVAAAKGQVKGLQTAYATLAKQKTQIIQEREDVQTPKSDDEMLARYRALGFHPYRSPSR